MEKTDIQLEIEGITVNCRAVGILFNNNKILFQKRQKDNFWALPGGKISIMEKGYHAVKRENFFEYEGKKFHEFIFIYSMELPKNSDILFHDESFVGAEKGKDLVFKWLDKEQILSENIAPNFMVNDLIDYIDECHRNKKYIRRMRRK